MMLSTSRVYSIRALAAIPVKVNAGPRSSRGRSGRPVRGLSRRGVAEDFSDRAARCPSTAAQSWPRRFWRCEYAEAFGFPVWINRCGVLAGRGPVRQGRPGHLFILDPFLAAAGAR